VNAIIHSCVVLVTLPRFEGEVKQRVESNVAARTIRNRQSSL